MILKCLKDLPGVAMVMPARVAAMDSAHALDCCWVEVRHQRNVALAVAAAAHDAERQAAMDGRDQD